MNPVKRWVTAAMAAAGLVALAAAPASAQTGATINPTARAAAEAAIRARLSDLNARVTLVTNDSPALASGDRSALLTELNSTLSGLQALDTTITNETSQSAFRAEALEIYSNFRVYALVLPQVHLVRAADELTTVVVPDLHKVEAALQSRATSATAATMADLAQQIQAIQTDTNGVSATLIALTPAEWNANHAIVSGPRQMLGSARTAALQALADVQKVRATL